MIVASTKSNKNQPNQSDKAQSFSKAPTNAKKEATGSVAKLLVVHRRPRFQIFALIFLESKKTPTHLLKDNHSQLTPEGKRADTNT